MRTFQANSFLLNHLTVLPDALAIDDGSTRLSWGELDHAVSCRSAWLLEKQCEPGDRVGLLMRNSSDYIPWVLAAISTGVWVVPLNWHLTEAEQRYIAEDSAMRLLVCESDFAGRELGCERFLPPVEHEPIKGLSLSEGSPAGGIMLYTSGTTGRPKGVQRRSPATLGELKKQWCEFGAAIGLDGGRHLVTGPLYHAAPLLFALYDLLNGGALMVMARFEAKKALELIDQFKISHSHWVPTMFVRALRLPEHSRDGFSGASLTLVLHGAAPIAPVVKRSVIEWWGPVLVEYWGGSESGAVSRCTSAQWLAHPGTVGKVLPHYEVIATRGGQALPEGEAGLLGIRLRSGEQAFSYWRDAEKTRRAYIKDAMFQLGDIGYVNEDYVYLLDRESHTVISGGVNIYPAEVEAALLQQALIADLAVFGVPDEEWGERLIAVLEVADDCRGKKSNAALSREILDDAAKVLASYKLPRELHFAEVGRNAAGKVPLASLRARYSS